MLYDVLKPCIGVCILSPTTSSWSPMETHRIILGVFALGHLPICPPLLLTFTHLILSLLCKFLVSVIVGTISLGISPHNVSQGSPDCFPIIFRRDTISKACQISYITLPYTSYMKKFVTRDWFTQLGRLRNHIVCSL